MIYIEFVLRISLSLALGFLIGLERQLTGHPAGIRINVLICMGTSFFTLFPISADGTQEQESSPMGRAAQGVFGSMGRNAEQAGVKAA